jgi:hypothetical protein
VCASDPKSAAGATSCRREGPASGGAAKEGHSFTAGGMQYAVCMVISVHSRRYAVCVVISVHSRRYAVCHLIRVYSKRCAVYMLHIDQGWLKHCVAVHALYLKLEIIQHTDESCTGVNVGF